jgi:hypothetical protein
VILRDNCAMRNAGDARVTIWLARRDEKATERDVIQNTEALRKIATLELGVIWLGLQGAPKYVE